MGGSSMSIGNFQFTKKTWIILTIGIVFVLIIVGVAANTASNNTKPSPTPHPTTIIPIVTPTPGPPPTVSFTVKSAVGVQTVAVTNQNTGSTITLTAADLPITLNCHGGDTLTFRVSAAAGYRFNTWMFGDNQFDSHNPYSVKATYAFTLEARFLMETPP
jgi:hypothetical protein